MMAAKLFGVVAMAGLGVAIALFLLTSQVNIQYDYSTPLCRSGEQLRVHQPGFDPVTGMPHGRSYSCVARGSVREITSFSPDPDLADRRAIPVPIGIIVGVAAASLLLLVNRRPGRPPLVSDEGSRGIRVR
jgi:hypothetical protein